MSNPDPQRYRIVRAFLVHQLAGTVTPMIEAGWVPLGGPFQVSDGSVRNHGEWCQALYRPKP